MYAIILNPAEVRDISPQMLDERGLLKVVPASILGAYTSHERTLFGMRYGFYGFLTQELVTFLRQFIAERHAIEIGSGHGGLAQALGIPAKDSRQQERPDVRAYYKELGQPVIAYGKNVEKLDALEAVRKYRPSVVVASWVTHRYDPQRHEAGGNQDGVHEEDVIANCDAYVFIGNERVHAGKSIWALPHQKIHPIWLYSRSINASPNFIAVWERTNLKRPA